MKKQNLMIFAIIIFLLNTNNILLSKNSENYQKARTGGSNLVFEENTNLSNLKTASENLIECNLPGVQLTQANLHRTDLTNGNLSQANLNQANCKRIIAPGINLSGAFLSGTDFKGATLTRANISGNLGFFKTLWQKITFQYNKNYVNFRTNVNFSRAILQKAFLNNCYLIDINFHRASLIGTNFRNSIIINCDFSNIKNLNNTNFSNSIIYNPNFKKTNLAGAIVQNTCIYSYTYNKLTKKQIEYLLKNGATIYLNNNLIEIDEQELGNQELGNQELSNQELGNQELGNQEPGNQEPGNQEPGNQEPGNQEPGNQELGNQEELEKELEDLKEL
ncbi:MAG: pentapeptide repeat-containing protein [Candidatus Babeliales bacterium]